MLSQKILRVVSKVALFLMVFAALAPGISHAIEAKRGAGFVQDVCTREGRKVTIEVLTTQGRQLTTEFNLKQKESAPKGIAHHLEHCPFCANPSLDAAIEAPHANIVAVLTIVAQRAVQAQQPALKIFSPLPPPAQAPPYSV